MRTTVLLGGRDEISPTGLIRDYLQAHKVNILWYEHFRHAQFLVHRHAQQSIIQSLLV